VSALAKPVWNYTAEQAQVYLAQGQTCRAAAIYRRLTVKDPSVENLTMLAGIYLQQGLNEDAIALHVRISKMERMGLVQ